MYKYFWEIQCNGPTSDLLSSIGLRTSMKLQDEGYDSIHFRSSTDDFYGRERLEPYIRPSKSLFSYRHAAVRASLGEFGARVRLTSVLTTAEFEYTPIVYKKVCLGKKCGLCLTNCGHLGALTVCPETVDNEIWLNPPSITTPQLCKNNWAVNHCKGMCLSKYLIGIRV